MRKKIVFFRLFLSMVNGHKKGQHCWPQIDDEPHVFSMGFIVLATEGRDRDIFLKFHRRYLSWPIFRS
ncbi:hypothetical protein, partial [Providencia rettgeri]|uniref:hypothetical protein n=1 Tax=Providencia rettgeri TaxID=587 RepID=UPI001C579964